MTSNDVMIMAKRICQPLYVLESLTGDDIVDVSGSHVCKDNRMWGFRSLYRIFNGDRKDVVIAIEHWLACSKGLMQSLTESIYLQASAESPLLSDTSRIQHPLVFERFCERAEVVDYIMKAWEGALSGLKVQEIKYTKLGDPEVPGELRDLQKVVQQMLLQHQSFVLETRMKKTFLLKQKQQRQSQNRRELLPELPKEEGDD